jgi:multidrug efflux pump subunit AcrA (membrane-fusion protein)
MFAGVRIKTGEEGEALAVPQNSLVNIQGLYFAYVAEGDRAMRRQVEIGRVVGQLVEINPALQRVKDSSNKYQRTQRPDKIMISE